MQQDIIKSFSDSYIDDYKYYYCRFNKIPNVYFIERIDISKAIPGLLKELSDKIEDNFYKKTRFPNTKKIEFSELFIVLKDEWLITMNETEVCKIMSHGKTDEQFQEIISLLNKYKCRDRQKVNEINLITMGRSGLELTNIDINKTNLNINTHYNDDFAEVHDIIIKRLNKKKDKGIILLHGLPGTGKTTYLRYLVAKITKRVLFVPPNIAANLANPDFINILIENPDSVLVIEDAENIIMDRSLSDGSTVSNLLNLSDGLLSDCLNIQIICTFNTHISTVDTALLRKGRLIAKYEFKELSIEKSKKLSELLKFEKPITESMILGDIFNQHEKDFENKKNKKNKLGF